MKLSEIMDALERTAPLHLQDDWDNSGLQVGSPDSEISRALICLDVTEDIVDEAISRGCQLILSHHPLIFKALRQLSGASYQQRCVIKALSAGIAIYSAHTSLDNARGGVNYRIAQLAGVKDLSWLQAKEGMDAGSGVVGNLEKEEDAGAFLERIARSFGVECLMHSECAGRSIRRVAICGGAGAFLLKDAIREGADCFICGEFHYHDYFENDGVILAELGHYQSEQFTMGLLQDLLRDAFPGLETELTKLNTNPIIYGTR